MTSLPRKRRAKRRSTITALIAVLLLLGAQSGVAQTTDVSARLIGRGVGAVAVRPPGSAPISKVQAWFVVPVYGDNKVSFGSVKTGDVVDAYSFQAHTNLFSAPCPGSTAQCQVWVEFGFANDGVNGRLYVKYWVVSPPGGCVQGWTVWDGNCYRKDLGPTIASMPFSSTTAERYRLTVDLSTAEDKVTFTNGTVSTEVKGARTFDARPAWDKAEFNVFGYGDGSTALFDTGTEFDVRTEYSYVSLERPGCDSTSSSGEASNLSFLDRKAARLQGKPGLQLRVKRLASGERAAPVPCGAAWTVGDTHELTFGGVSYDFQATGDFVEAQVGTDFEVQTRKAPAAEPWPLTSLNRSVGTRMGNNRIALCDGTRLLVNGSAVTLAPGESLPLQGGVTISRDGTTYTATDPAKRVVRFRPTTVGSQVYNDLQIGLPTWPVPVRGLMGTPDPNTPELLGDRDGRTTYRTPISFEDLYYNFGDGWRISPTGSLLALCAAVPSTNPPNPYFAADLPTTYRDAAWRTCLNGRIAKEWYDACLLDVAVLGTGAAATYVSRMPPINGNPDHAEPPGPTCPPTHGCRANPPR
ncbi:VWD domain-containing protein [Actinosynnema sp. NPDC020468]|uniref:VWD domain-containing protein n=1 Tax=Actinosynnema sp. NPDC020468 TaxID=3154488 RepID=UPI0033FA90FE